MKTKKRQNADPVMQWMNERANDPEHREAVDALLTEIDVRQDLIALREERGLTQVELAERVGVTQPTIAKLEGGGTRDVKLSTLVRVAAALGARIRITFEKNAGRAKRRKAAVA